MLDVLTDAAVAKAVAYNQRSARQYDWDFTLWIQGVGTGAPGTGATGTGATGTGAAGVESIAQTIAAFQLQRGLAVDGMCGPATLAAKKATLPVAGEPPWMAIARGEIGVCEIPGDNHHSARILEYQDTTAYDAPTDEIPWCAAYVCWVLEQAGIRSTQSAAARSYDDWGEAIECAGQEGRIPPGALVTFWRGKDPSDWKGHVGFYVGGVPSTGRIQVLAGNSSNRVQIATESTERFLGARWPEGVERVAAGEAEEGPGEAGEGTGEAGEGGSWA